MRSVDFPWCCGVDILGGFPEDYYHRNKTQKEKEIQNMRNRILDGMDGGKGLLLAITNRDQLPTSVLLKKFGFRLLRQFYNPNSGYRLKLWELNLNKITKAPYKIDQIADKLIKQLD